jgi:RNA-directed DNA polymerase
LRGVALNGKIVNTISLRSNAGAAGIDGMTVEMFESREEELLLLIHEKLKKGTYRFEPARRVLIPKEGNPGKTRKLGIPVIMDRVVSQSINTALGEIFDAEFSGSNFGYRPGKSQHQAIKHVQKIVAEGYEWCASIDLHSFFDEIPHDLILKLIRRKISDEGLVTLIARALKAGVIEDGVFVKTLKGSPQGSPLSPILSNIVLNELDQELEKKGLGFCRWADDFLIMVKSERVLPPVNVGPHRHRKLGPPDRFLLKIEAPVFGPTRLLVCQSRIVCHVICRHQCSIQAYLATGGEGPKVICGSVDR